MIKRRPQRSPSSPIVREELAHTETYPSAGFSTRLWPSANAPNSVDVTVTATGRASMTLILTAPGNQPLTPGVYENTVSGATPRGPSTPGLVSKSHPGWLSWGQGRFEVYEAVYGPNGLERFRVAFERHCNGIAPGVVGEFAFVEPPPPGPIVPPPPPPGATNYMTFRGDPVVSGQSRTEVAPGSTFLALYPSVQSFGQSLELVATRADGSRWVVRLAAPAGEVLRPGPYYHATQTITPSAGSPALDFMVGVGPTTTGCQSIGRFEINQIIFAPDNTLAVLKARFERHCDRAVPGVVGEISLVAPFNGSAPTSATVAR